MKKKMRLNVEELNVEAFATTDAAAKRGTVHGHDDTDSFSCGVCHTAGDPCTQAWDSCSGPYPCICPETTRTACC